MNALQTLLQQYQGTVDIGSIILAVFCLGLIVVLIQEACKQDNKQPSKKFYYASYTNPKKMIVFDIK